MTFIVFKKLTPIQALENARDIEQWFIKNPTRRVCRTDLFTVRRHHVVEDILKHTEEWPAEGGFNDGAK